MKKALTFLAAATLAVLPVFAQDGAPAPAAREGGGLFQTVMMIAIALVFFYFILWRSGDTGALGYNQLLEKLLPV